MRIRSIQPVQNIYGAAFGLGTKKQNTDCSKEKREDEKEEKKNKDEFAGMLADEIFKLRNGK